MTIIQGFGLGLRTVHYQDFILQRQNVDWLEIISENYLIPGGKPLQNLEAIRKDYPMVMHGVSLSIGSCDALNRDYLRQLKALMLRIQPGWVSDHLCWTGVNQTNMHDLLPVPYTQEALDHIVSRVLQVQDFLGQRLVLENPSTYVTFKNEEMSEQDFMCQLIKRTDCGLLLDVNNVYVSAFNHGFDAHRYIDALPTQNIMQIHLAGHEKHPDYIIDTHDHDIAPPVFDLYHYTLKRHGFIPTMIERDDNIPPLSVLLTELEAVKTCAANALNSPSIAA